jgi:hypothetical protein
VTFDNRDGRGLTGVIVRINRRTAATGAGTADSGTWLVPLHMLRHVLDISASSVSCSGRRQQGGALRPRLRRLNHAMRGASVIRLASFLSRKF